MVGTKTHYITPPDPESLQRIFAMVEMSRRGGWYCLSLLGRQVEECLPLQLWTAALLTATCLTQ